VGFLPLAYTPSDSYPFYTSGNIGLGDQANVHATKPGWYKVEGFFDISIDVLASIHVAFSYKDDGDNVTSYPSSGMGGTWTTVNLIKRFTLTPRYIQTTGVNSRIYPSFSNVDLNFSLGIKTYDHMFSVQYIGDV
jgi:hypothetical protein